MKHLLNIVAVAIGLVAISWVAVQRFEDRATFVPPPDAIAEGFMREVVMRRFDQARDYLSEKRQGPQVRPLAESIEAQLGSVDDVQAEMISATEEEALARVTLRSATGSVTFSVWTVWEGAAWRVAEVKQGA